MKIAIELLTYWFMIKMKWIISGMINYSGKQNLSYPDTGAGDTNRPTFCNRYDKSKERRII